MARVWRVTIAVLALVACENEIGGGGRRDASAGSDASMRDAAADMRMAAPDLPVAPPCDDGFSIAPIPAATGSVISIAYTHPEGFTFIGLELTGPGATEIGSAAIGGGGPYTWTFPTTAAAAGRYTATFLKDMTVVQATCSFDVVDTGPPPDLEDPVECLCGESCADPSCPVVGSCFDSPSPYAPGGSGTWQCLDNAGCDGGNCRIWCPFEPCPREGGAGCVNNTEACWVNPSITDYDEACRVCCESAPRNAEWNSVDHYCMEPRPL